MQVKFFLLLFFICSVAADSFAQNTVGVWEGSFFLRGNKKNKMNVRLELMQTENEILGIISTRGFDVNTVYGCDYLVSGSMVKKKLIITRAAVRRGVAMSKTDCSFFRRIEFQPAGSDTSKILSGKWVWGDDESNPVILTKTDTSISETAKDEISNYIEDVYDLYEENNVFLTADERLKKKAAEFTIDSTEITIDFYSIEKNSSDSVTVYLSGELIAESFPLAQKPLRIRLQKPGIGIGELLVVNASLVKPRLRLRLLVKQGEQTHERILEPGFVKNVTVWLNRDEE